MKKYIIYPESYIIKTNESNDKWSLEVKGNDIKSGDRIEFIISNNPAKIKCFKENFDVLFVNDLKKHKTSDNHYQVSFDIRDHKGYTDVQELKDDFAKYMLFNDDNIDIALKNIIEIQSNKLPSYDFIQKEYFDMLLEGFEEEKIDEIILTQYKNCMDTLELNKFAFETVYDSLKSIDGFENYTKETYKTLKK